MQRCRLKHSKSAVLAGTASVRRLRDRFPELSGQELLDALTPELTLVRVRQEILNHTEREYERLIAAVQAEIQDVQSSDAPVLVGDSDGDDTDLRGAQERQRRRLAKRGSAGDKGKGKGKEREQ